MYFDFFESLDPERSASNIWQKYDPKIMNGAVIFQGTLKKHSKETGEGLSERHFILQKEWLLYKKNKDADVVNSAMHVKYARLVLPGTDDADATPAEMIKDKYAIKVCSRKKYSLLYAVNEEEYNKWINAFGIILIRTDFHHRFSVSKIIGSGAFANVYEATEKSSNKRFAVKGFNKQYLEQEPKGKISLWNEVCVLREMDHRNLLRLYEVHESKNSVYLVFDIYDGGELSKYLENKKEGVKESEAINILLGLLRGIDFIASKEMVHRDLKPTNIMLRKTTDIQPDDVIIVDFGLAASIHEKNMIYKRCGTPGYIAPEIIGAKDVDKNFTLTTKCDVFSLGVLLYLMLAGEAPFEKPEWNVDTIIKKNLECRIDWPEARFSKYNSELIKLLKTMITFDPNHRISAKVALKSPILEGDDLDTDLGGDIDEFGSSGGDQRSSVHTSIKSLSRRGIMIKGKEKEIDCGMSNKSIRVDSKGLVDKQINEKQKTSSVNLYKQSLMKGTGGVSHSSSRKSSVDKGKISVGISEESDEDEDDENEDPLRSPGKRSPHRRSNFADKNNKSPVRTITPILLPYVAGSKNVVRSSSKPKDQEL